MITYEVPDNLDGKNQITVVYKNENGHVFTKSVNVPRNEDGSIDEEYFNSILEGQLRGVENKLKVGAIEFVDPSEKINPEDVPETVKDTI